MRTFAALLCAVLLVTLLPTTALAADGGNISTTGLDLSSPPTVETTYLAGAGTVVWDPTASPATLTFNNATVVIPPTSGDVFLSNAFILPNVPVNVVFNGTNSITVQYCTDSRAFKCSAATTFDLGADSSTTLELSGQNTDGIISSSAVTVNGNGATLTIKSNGYYPGTIYAGSNAVTLNGGTMAFTGSDGIKAGAITLNGVTVPAGKSLSMLQSSNATITGSSNTINGEVVMPYQRPYNIDDFTLFTGSGTIKGYQDGKIYNTDGFEIFTVSFNSNGGSTVSSITGVTTDSTITAPTEPTKTNYVFSGWYKEDALTNKWNFDTDTVSGNITLYAKWLTRPICVAPTGVTAIYGKTLANVILTNPEGNTPGSWSWKTTGSASATVGDVGTNTFQARFTPTDKTYGRVDNINVSVTVTPRQLTVSGTTAANKPYDGNTTAAVTVGTVDGIVSGDGVTVTATGTFNTKEEGTNKTVSVTYALTGDDAGNYLAPVNGTTTANITAPAVATPGFSPVAGTYTSAQSVTLSCATAGAHIYYTTNGNEPTEADTLFVSGTPITVSTTTTIKAKAFMTGMTPSAVTSATYTIGTPPSGPAYQIIEGQAGVWAQGSGAGLRFRASGAYDQFLPGGSVQVDDATIPGNKYTSEDGSTVVTLKAPYLATLSIGPHRLRITFNDGGYAETQFSITAAPAPIPKTGDDATPLLWLGIALMAGVTLAASVGIRRKRQNG